jgi:bacteriophage exclusion system BrxB-like protein
VPPREELRRIGERIAAHFDAGGEPPFVLYQYLPDQEWHVRRDLADLRRWLEAEPRRLGCAAVSLADLFWQALDESDFLDELVAQEREAAGDANALRDVYAAVGEILREPPTLPDRVLTEVADCADRTAVILYRAGALYPAYRTSTLLDDLRGRLSRPVTLLYPGRLVGEYGLSFMDRTEPAYGYRALIVPREASS